MLQSIASSVITCTSAQMLLQIIAFLFYTLKQSIVDAMKQPGPICT